MRQLSKRMQIWLLIYCLAMRRKVSVAFMNTILNYSKYGDGRSIASNARIVTMLCSGSHFSDHCEIAAIVDDCPDGIG